MPSLLDISTDQPLDPTDALEKDGLARSGFAKATVEALRTVSSSAGFVISIEGPWGSGKTSIFAMIEQLLRQNSEKQAIIVHFNPWLVGDRDGLLRQFLSSISHAISLGDKGKEARKVAEELRNYSKVFDFIKYIPGAEPWATIVKSVVKSAGDAADAFGAQKELNLEDRKRAVEKALAALGRKIYVFIDDIDRLYPAEVFEIVRIIKSVGELPNVGYIVAWDPDYVRRALKAAKVPQSSTYLDKIVQVRLPIPAISSQLKVQLVDKALRSVHPAALDDYFPRQRERFQVLYVSGFSELLEQPRDITRVINTFNVIEPDLRGEIVPADILGLACLMVRAPRVYGEIRRDPRPFITEISESKDDRKEQERREVMDKLFSLSPNPTAVRQLVRHLFPITAQASGAHYHIRPSEVEGHLAAPGRLGIALGMSIGEMDVSIADARRYLLDTGSRKKVVERLTAGNLFGFLEVVSKVKAGLPENILSDRTALCLEIAAIVDLPRLHADRESIRRSAFSIEDRALRAIETIAGGTPNIAKSIAFAIVCNSSTLTTAAAIIANTLDKDMEKHPYSIVLSEQQLKLALERFTRHVCSAAASGTLWEVRGPGRVLNAVSCSAAKGIKSVFAALKKEDPTLDKFAMHFFESGFNSNHGASFSLRPTLCIENFTSLKSLRVHARKRIKEGVAGETLIAWRSVAEDKSIYADGTDRRW